jgi:hypothetical protein
MNGDRPAPVRYGFPRIAQRLCLAIVEAELHARRGFACHEGIVKSVLDIARKCRVLVFATVAVAGCGQQPETSEPPEISDIELEWCTAGHTAIGLAAAQELGRAEEFLEARRKGG